MEHINFEKNLLGVVSVAVLLSTTFFMPGMAAAAAAVGEEAAVGKAPIWDPYNESASVYAFEKWVARKAAADVAQIKAQAGGEEAYNAQVAHEKATAIRRWNENAESNALKWAGRSVAEEAAAGARGRTAAGAVSGQAVGPLDDADE